LGFEFFGSGKSIVGSRQGEIEQAPDRIVGEPIWDARFRWIVRSHQV
jgi:hypothetical protein